MRATLEFELPEDNSDFRLAVNGPRYWSALIEFSNELRNAIKYGDYKTVQECLEDIERKWRDSTEDVNFDEIP